MALQSVAQSPDSALMAAARTASSAFHDRSAAIRAGYRKLGPEIPEMGEHWINPVMIVESRYDPRRPAVLTYATIAGKTTLTGVAYALAMRAGESPPQTGVQGVWHDHAATVDRELTGVHGGMAAGSRVVVMHAWVWLSNPAGPFSDANWALPFARVGLTPPDRIDPRAGRAVSLLFDGSADYYSTVLRAFVQTDAQRFADAAAEVRALIGTRTVIDAAMADELAAIWTRLVESIARTAPQTQQPHIRAALIPHH
jgi:hypothetical protein